ncbi:uncharacterized protein LY89DRAFT_777246 [Mollisia scopiformis]|uniref:Uncharacterized protein n=1 Tax=Mollisia scopiformis TaxID=149040 RepID=A0A194XTP3_MOLSC|nr:uncharacterized protein LY89DRAFT_777246 [Mollisia scopiformis]KUJ23511.1 hypothetical protein LY89DRAFT_777246 [Mollisia scopiformis]
MKTFLSPNFMPMVVTQDDLIIAAIALGHAIKQTVAIYRRYGAAKLNSPYVWMIWGEIFACLVFAIICWLHLTGVIPPSLVFFFSILTAWSLQVQFLLQIIINRISLLLTNRRKALKLKIGVAVLITAINISVYNIWIPSRLQISPRYEYINSIWDRCEKIIFLIVDGCLNWLFIKTVREKLVSQGLVKYNRLVRFNQWIIGLSLAMDCLIIGMMSLSNSFVYMQIHPLAYIVKLNIEMSMAELPAKISANNNTTLHFLASSSTPLKPHPNLVANQLSKTFGVSQDVAWRTETSYKGSAGRERDGDIMLNAKQEVSIQVERRKSLAPSWREDGGSILDGKRGVEDDMMPLRDEDRRREARERDKMGGVERGMGVVTQIWGSGAEQRQAVSEGTSRRNIRA